MNRVLPRDAFNDANLLKCVGKITLLIEDGIIKLTYEYDGKPFDIQQDESDGSTYIANVSFFTPSGKPLQHRRPLNSRARWPLELILGDDVYYAFTEMGKFMPNFGEDIGEDV